MMISSSEQERILSEPKQADLVEVQYFTDPLCCWSWAFEPQWRKFQYIFRDLIRIKTVLGGLIKDWKSFHDPFNSISRPSQMGPLWMEVKHLSGMPLHDMVWITDPPSGSYLACIAVKAAQLQSEKAGSLLLRSLREALMMDGNNISRKDFVLETACAIEKKHPGTFNCETFVRDLNGNEAVDAFRKDLEKVRYHGITRFPTITFQRNGKGVIITGYRPFGALLEAFLSVYPEAAGTSTEVETSDYKTFWPSLTERELKEL